MIYLISQLIKKRFRFVITVLLDWLELNSNCNFHDLESKNFSFCHIVLVFVKSFFTIVKFSVLLITCVVVGTNCDCLGRGYLEM